MKSLRSQNYYEVLGISRYASPDEIRDAYELSKLTFTQNSMATYSLFSEDENREILDLITKACETLLNPELRREYDTCLDSGDKADRPSWEEREVALLAQGHAHRQQGGMLHNGVSTSEAPIGRGGAMESPTQESPHSETRSMNSMKGANDAERYIESVETYTGESLRRFREIKGLALSDLANSTKIRNTYIGYIEEENFSGLPAAVYVKGFVKLIAQALGLPADKVTHDYMIRYRSLAGKNQA